MWEARSTWHCSNCGTELFSRDAECYYCYRGLYIEHLEDLVRSLGGVPTCPKMKWNESKTQWELDHD